jgi:hypothetical protein
MNADTSTPLPTRYVHGYASTGLLRPTLAALRDFRQIALPVDLRIERALISAAIELCLETPQLAVTIQDRIAQHFAPANRSARARIGQDDVASVLIKRTLKLAVMELLGTPANRSAQNHSQDPLSTLFVSNGVDLVMADAQYHQSWIDKTAEIVQWEIKSGFDLAKGRY